jgi:hypothetical protein
MFDVYGKKSFLHISAVRWTGTTFFFSARIILRVMATSESGKSGPKDKSYVNRGQKHEVKYEPHRKSEAKKFGSRKSK